MLLFLQHDYNNFNVKAIVNLKGSGCNIWEEVFEVLHGARRDIFRRIVFGYLLDVPHLQGDVLLFHKMFLHHIRSDDVLSPDDIKRLYFRVGDTKMIYGPEEFCLITGFNFGEYPKNIGKKVSEKKVTTKKKKFFGKRNKQSSAARLIAENLDIDKYLSLSERGQTFKYSILGFTAPFRIWIYEMFPIVRVGGFALRKNRDTPRMKQ
uniref:DUF1985 domain-containing protein n=1 Tax=Lactuca sativa TaxID=4236 RepID=A0A9R1X6R2_LACSA|nr:hypothetical protein LSAT_V11C600324800 [Lactuca sativa]